MGIKHDENKPRFDFHKLQVAAKLIRQNALYLRMEHWKPATAVEQRENEILLTVAARKDSGVYLYEDDKGAVLYVGKAKSIASRLISHYRESFQPVPGDTKTQKWHRFFKEHQGIVHIRWWPIRTEPERVVAEVILSQVLKPLFDRYE